MTTARILVIQGCLLIAVAVIHLLMTAEIGHIVSLHTTPEAFVFLWPPYELDHIAVGILLAAMGVLAIISAGGIRARERSAWWIAIVNALAIICMGPAIVLTVGVRYFADAPAFLTAALVLLVLGVWMLIPLLWIRTDVFAARGP